MLKKMFVAGLVCIASLAEAITLVSPEDGAIVPLLSEKQKAFMAMSREERAKFFDDAQPKMESAIKHYRSDPRPVVLEWSGEGGPYEVSVTRRGAKSPWFAAAVATNRIEVWNLEIAATYDWTVRCEGETAKGSFMTEDQAPRLMRIPKVPNVRDIGGRVIGGRRVRQGLVYRSSGLNNNAATVFYTMEEIKKLEAEGKLASMGELGAKYSAKLKSGKELDRKYLRLIKSEPTEPGTARLTKEWRRYMVEQLGIKTDIDLRSTRERFGMTCSPLGPGVKFVTMPTNYHGYAAIHTTGADDTRRVLRVFLDRSNYPIDFHCIGGADRTGTVATILHGILGLDDDEIWKDYQITAWQGGVNDARHLKWFTDFVKSFDKFEGATLADRIRKYVLWLGFTEADMQKIRDIMLEPPSKDFAGLFPPDVKTVGIVSASSLIPVNAFVRGTNLLAKAGYRVKAMPNVLKMETPDVRARLFEQAWLDPEIDILLFSRGGQGAEDVIPLIDWDGLRGRNMRVLGFSDVTLVLGTMLAKGVGTPISGPMLSTLSTYCTSESRERLRQVLDGNPPPLKLVPVKPCASPVCGKPFAGIIPRFPVLLDKGLLPSFDGRVVFVESTPKYADVAEKILNDLVARGVFDKAAAVVFCDFNRKWERARVEALFARFAAKVPCPVFSGYPYGHVPRSFAVNFTRSVRISQDGVLTWESI